MLRLCGREKSALALNLTGYIISIPVFFDAAFVKMCIRDRENK